MCQHSEASSVVQDMSAIDKVMHFQKGLLVEIRQEVKLRQFRSTTEAISFALMYDRTHNVGSRGQNKEQASRRTQGQRRFHHPQTPVEEPTPMEIGSSRFVSRDECLRNNLCFYCKERDHRVADCRKRQTPSTSRGSARPAVGQSSFRTNQSSFRRVVEDDDAEEEEEDDTVALLHSMQLNIVAVQTPSTEARGLLRANGLMNGQFIRIRIDSGAERNIVCPGLAQHFVECCKGFAEVPLIELEVSVNQDVILGHPWLVQFNPSIDWHTGAMRFREQRKVVSYRAINDSHPVKQPVEVPVVSPEFLQHPMPPDLRQQLNDHVKAGYFHMPLGPSSMPALRCTPPSQVSGKKNDDDEYASLCVLSAEKFESKVKAREYVKLFHVTVKTSLKQSCPLSTFQGGTGGLERSVADLLKKNWIQVSDSPWVSHIFGVPKKDPVTGKFPSRLEWLHSNNPHMPIRRVIDYRLVNAASEVAKITLPHIEELLDQMEGATVFSILDLANGYHQMRMSPTSKQFTAFRTNHEIYEWNVAPMGLAGMPGTWTRLMRKLLQSFRFVKDVVWVWDEPQQRAFSSVKLALQQAPVLRLPDFDKPFIVRTDASHNCVGGVLSQLQDGHDLPVAFYSKKLGVHELNWPVHEKKLFAINRH
ncbi:unnamed protein product [Phytophthora lilii]|uniref:Unnamed protein product n=1 Tax=Phytophthora lilii TaxID=2077276 RepID=A0A9W6U5I5_9STRA|nr:unnamed protein product [Phytophthora lilii]